MTTAHPLRDKRVLLVEPDANFRADLCGRLQKYGCKMLAYPDNVTAFSAIQNGEQIDLAILSVNPPVASALDFVWEVRSSCANTIPIFLICAVAEPGFDEAFYYGVDAIFVKPLLSDEIERGVTFSYVESTNLGARQHERQRVWRARVHYEFDEQLATGYAMNFGSGGMFIGTMQTMPARNQEIRFHLSFEMEADKVLSGTAIVKWLRPGLQYGRPRGFGVEYADLSDEMKKKLDEMVQIASSSMKSGGSGSST